MKLVPSDAAPASAAVPVRIPTLGVAAEGVPRRVLAFDFEALATGYADPKWVPQVTTAISYSWLGEERVESLAVCDYSRSQMPHLDKAAQRAMLEDFLSAYNQADGLSFHNGRRYDQPVLNGMSWWVGLPPIEPKVTTDTIDLGKVKGVKKGQDNIGILLGIPVHKLSLNHEQWIEAYAEAGWPTVKERCSSDVIQHKLIRNEMQRRGWLRAPKVWKP